MGIQSEIRDHILSQPSSFKKKKEYKIEELLGTGGFGKVLRATWTPKGGEKRDVALNKRNVKANVQVRDEISVLKGLDHPHIVHLLDYFESRDKHYMAFELATGKDLFERVSSRGRFVEKDAMECIRQVLQATAYLHHHRIVHRDLKPENIIYKTKDLDSPIVVADFGIAKLLSDEEGEEGQENLNAAGSPGYCAPEVLLAKAQGRKVDCWSIGVITYTLLCGYTPFPNQDNNELIREMTKGKITFHERYWKKVSENAKDFIRAMLQVDPAKRLSAEDALKHPWLLTCEATDHNLAPAIKEHFTARKRWNKAFIAISAANRLRSGPNSTANSPALPSISTPSHSANASPSSSTGSVSDAAVPITPSSGSRLEVPLSSPERLGGTGALTPLSMSEDEGFVTADEEAGHKPATSPREELDRTPGTGREQEEGSESTGEKGTEPVSAGLRGMMGRLGLGR